jgi:sarcosine oxidase subunit gamma
MNTLKPAALRRRSFHYRTLAAAGAVFVERNGAGVAWHYGGTPEAEAAIARTLAVIDLSPLPRSGYKGRDALAWLSEQGLVIGEDSNRAYRQSDGLLVAKLAPGEALILADPAHNWDGALDAAWEESERLCFPVPRRESSLWFRVVGRHAAAMFAKLCGVDLRPHKFSNWAIAQTSIARMNGIVIRDDIGEVPAYHLLADSASADYLWNCLIDAMAEFGGGPVGLAGLLVLGEQRS